MIKIILAVLALNLIALVSKTTLGLPIHIFDMDWEKNIPTLIETLLFLAVAMEAWRARKTASAALKRGWGIITGVFLFLALDEWLMIHDSLTEGIRTTLNTTGILYFAWVIPYAGLVLIFGLIMLKFLLKLPQITRLQLIASGIIFVGGALGFELINGLLKGAIGADSVLYALGTTTEELMEFTGLALALTAIMRHTGFILPNIVSTAISRPRTTIAILSLFLIDSVYTASINDWNLYPDWIEAPIKHLIK
ncbi:MAG: hypothetical protein O3A01_08610 [bacterium]|nr:hypothetical protein [bacterium]